MRKKRLENWLCLSGITSPIFYVLHDIIGGMYYPGYDRLSQAVSDLTAADAPSFVIATGLSTVYALFACMCCTLVCITVQDIGNKTLRLGIYLFALMNWISGIGYSLFPLSSSGYAGSFQDIVHVYIVTVLVVVLSIVSLISIMIGGFKDNRYRSLSVWAMFALLFMFTGAVGASIVPSRYFGLVERFSTYSVVTFVAVLGLYGFHYFAIIE
ncbi:MAG: DUF998 domain-containing protein [Firmicutes bacterium]|nr:DUF998 domain-containing protein [Bacillota bacterium]